MRMTRLAWACALLLMAPRSASAERYALLVGVSQYRASSPDLPLNLEGPAEDVPALRQVLTAKYGFAERNVLVLLDGAATRQGILTSLSEVVGRLKSGDFLLFYFSGHGTSGFDEANRAIAPFIGPDSGALIPHDLTPGDPATIADSLIIGRRDLRPRLEKVPHDSTALVILDACYSGDSVRSIQDRLAARGITLGAMVGTRRGPAPPSAPAPTSPAAATMYPYSNVISLTASSKAERARDIRRLDLAEYPSIDGKPHGAFTDSLLRGLAGSADLNHDGTTTVRELHAFTRSAVQARFGQTPQLLSADATALLDSDMFAARHVTTAACEPPRPESRARVRVRLDAVAPHLTAAVRAAGVDVVQQSPDVTIRQNFARLELFDAAGVLIQDFRESELEPLMSRVHAEPAVKSFVSLAVLCQSFGAYLRLRPEGQSLFSAGERIEIEGRVDRDAYLVLLNIDKAGVISILYPATPAERRKQAAAKPIHLGTVQGVAPFGSESLKLIALSSEPGLEALGCRVAASGAVICREITPGSEQFAALQRLLTQSGRDAAEAHLRFTTYDR